MKKIVALLFVLVGMSCQPDINKDIGTSYDLTTGIDGSWVISKVEITDLTLPVPESREISEFYTETNPLQIDFDVEAGTYAVKNPERPGNSFGSLGTFAYNHPEFPTALTLITVENDTLQFEVENMVRSIDPKMGLKFTKVACDKAYVNYSYTFNRR